MGKESNQALIKKKSSLEIPEIIFVDIMMRYSLIVQHYDMKFHKFLTGRLVILYGTSSAGKSSIANYIESRANKKGVSIRQTGTDFVWSLHIYDLFEKRYFIEAKFLRHFFSLEEIFDCIWNESILEMLLVKKAFNENGNGIIRSIFSKFRREQVSLLGSLSKENRPYFCSQSFLPGLAQGKLVIADSAADPGDIEEFFHAMEVQLVHCRTDVVVVYCSPKKLMDHILLRNENAIKVSSLNKSRVGAFPLEQYINMYKPTNQVENAIDFIDSSDGVVPQKLIEICEILQFLLIKELSSSFVQEYSSDQWGKISASLMGVFGLKSAEKKMPVTPRFNYQFFVDAGRVSANECGINIIKTLKLF